MLLKRQIEQIVFLNRLRRHAFKSLMGVKIVFNNVNILCLLSVEFSLADSEKYSPFRNLEIQEVNFVFRERPGKSEIVAYGKHTFINNVFAVEVVPGPTLTGKTSGSTTLGILILLNRYPEF